MAKIKVTADEKRLYEMCFDLRFTSNQQGEIVGRRGQMIRPWTAAKHAHDEDLVREAWQRGLVELEVHGGMRLTRDGARALNNVVDRGSETMQVAEEEEFRLPEPQGEAPVPPRPE